MESKRVKSKCGELHEEEEARTKKVCVSPRERIVNDGGKECITCEYKHSSSTILHFAASNVASICGVHEYADVRGDFIEHLYQGLDEMLQEDAQVLSLQLVSIDTELGDLIARTGKNIGEQLNKVLRWTKRREGKTNRKELSGLTKSVETLLKKATREKLLNAGEADEIRSSMRGRLAKSLGNRNESLAIQTYERQRGCLVRQCNEEMFCLNFSPVDDITDIEEMENAINRANDEQPDPKLPYFRLFGKIDGMTDVLVVEEGEDGEWRMEPIVIEVKNRVNGFRDPPPVYDQIQTTVYMKMLDCRQADLIQCITDDRAKVHVSRITLDDPPLHTGAAWKDILVPRMFKYAQVIYKVRSNPMLRLAILNSEEEAQRNIILDLCPWLS